MVLEEQEVHGDHDGHHREHVKYGGYLSAHGFVLLRATERSKSGAIHLATARLLAPELDALVAYDDSLIRAATDAGLAAVSPGAEAI